MDVTSQSFRICWLPPSDLNAPDVNYTLLLITEAPRAVDTITGIVDETYLFEALRPFTNYTVVTFAVSEKGPGLGSDPIRVMTLRRTVSTYYSAHLIHIPCTTVVERTEFCSNDHSIVLDAEAKGSVVFRILIILLCDARAQRGYY